jgi:putative ABC transport system ATP-binding protein
MKNNVKELSLIEMSGVEKNYGASSRPTIALRDLNLNVSRGEYIALVGPSGSGKSTLLHIIGCLDTPSNGQYLLNGIDVGSLNRNKLADIRNRTIGFVFQKFHLLPRATALENVALPMRFAGVNPKSRLEKAANLLRQVGLEDRLNYRPSELSGGQQQRVAVARALANKPSLLLADEPTGNLDSKAGMEIIELLETLQTEDKTVIMVTHDEQLAKRAHRIIHLLDGKKMEDQIKAAKPHA